MTLQEIIERSGNLPASLIAEEVNKTLEDHPSLVITAPPGAGKSTLLPLSILKGNRGGGKILMLEPRRLAARQIAERMASVLGEPVGKTVGYRVRFETKVSTETRIEVLTEGILAKMLVNDATLEGIDGIIFDEFHERSIHSDLALALTRQAQEILRPDLKIVIMSATIDTSFICQLLHAPLIESEGKMHDVETVYADDDLSPFDVAQAVAATIVQAHQRHEGDILAFLPGQGDILKCEEILRDVFSQDSISSSERTSITQVYPLYGNLSPEKQRIAIAPSKVGCRKIVLATPIAETSLTIEGVRIVIDSGLCRKMVYDARTGLSHLETVRISKDMAIQRRGRAGRITEGVCYRLWTKTSEHLMDDQRKPEIEEADLSSMLLDIAAFGENDVYSLPWLTSPPKGNMQRAKELLVSLKAFKPNSASMGIPKITDLGRQMAELPCHPRIAKMILSGKNSLDKALACDLAAILEEKDPLSEEGDSNMEWRVSILRDCRRKKTLGKWARIAKIAQEYRKTVLLSANHRKEKKVLLEDNAEVDSEEIGYLLACAYPERIAMSVDGMGTYKLANGELTHLDMNDSLIGHKWIAIGALGTKVFLAAPLNIKSIQPTLRNHVAWDGKQGCVVMQQEYRIGKLVIDCKPIHDADISQIISMICDAVKKDGLSMLDWGEKVKRLQCRVAKVAEWHPELGVPDLSTEHLLATASEWLPFYLEQGGKVKTTIGEFKKINLEEVLWNIIPYELQQMVERLAPSHVQVPTGSKIRIDYRPGAAAPVLSVRLQECFGMTATPCVNDGKQPLLMELLSPGFKPVQLTQDLCSFWQGTYFEVRKELKQRYPKHEWPDNPQESEAVKGVKRKVKK